MRTGNQEIRLTGDPMNWRPRVGGEGLNDCVDKSAERWFKRVVDILD